MSLIDNEEKSKGREGWKAFPPPPHSSAEKEEKGKKKEEEEEEDDQNIPVDHLLILFQSRHTLLSRYNTSEQRQLAQITIDNITREKQMAPFIRLLQDALDWNRCTDEELEAMDVHNAKKLEQLEKRCQDAVMNLGDSEVREALFAICQHYYSIGELHQCLSAIEACNEKTIASNLKMDLCLMRIRLGLAFENNEISAKGIQDAHRLIKDSNWERRNRLKVYEGIYHVIIRDFRRASELLLDSLSTFASGELIAFQDYVFITIVVSLPILPREVLKKKIIDSPEVLNAGVADAYDLVVHLYKCQYKHIFPSLDVVCQHIRCSAFLSSHLNYFFREARALAFSQFLDSYSSVTLTSMSHAFGIPERALDELLSTMISNERLPCRMDLVSGSIKTYRGDHANFDYHKLIKSGDLLLNRLQKLTRLVEI